MHESAPESVVGAGSIEGVGMPRLAILTLMIVLSMRNSLDLIFFFVDR